MNPDCNEELAVAAAVVYGPCLDMVREKLLPDDFQNPELKALFQAACDLQDEGEKPNQVTIVRRCEDTGHPVGGGTLEAMHRSQVEESEIPGFCDRIADRAKDAALAKGLERCLSALKNGKSRLAVLSDLESVIMDCEKSCSGLLDSKKSTAKLAVYREKVETGSAAFIRTGFPWLDDALGGGMQGGGVYIIAARPGVGKTSLAINIGHQVSRAGTRVLFISLEMAAHQDSNKADSL